MLFLITLLKREVFFFDFNTVRVCLKSSSIVVIIGRGTATKGNWLSKYSRCTMSRQNNAVIQFTELISMNVRQVLFTAVVCVGYSSTKYSSSVSAPMHRWLKVDQTYIWGLVALKNNRWWPTQAFQPRFLFFSPFESHKNFLLACYMKAVQLSQ